MTSIKMGEPQKRLADVFCVEWGFTLVSSEDIIKVFNG